MERNRTGLVLSLFPGIDLLGQAFELEGFHVVRGPDPALGTGDIRRFHVPPDRFAGVIGGPPCVDFSRARRSPATGFSRAMLLEFARIVREAEPDWWLLENVPQVPDVQIPGFTHQRIDVHASEFGLAQNRNRHFQFGNASNGVLSIERGKRDKRKMAPCCIASEGEKQGRRDWGDFCELMGLPRDFELPYFTLSARYRAVGNGVPIPMGRAVARGILQGLLDADIFMVCACGCGRKVEGRQRSATMACRQRLSRRNRRV